MGTQARIKACFQQILPAKETGAYEVNKQKLMHKPLPSG